MNRDRLTATVPAALLVAALPVAALLIGCATATDMSRVSGTVTYRERIAMPPGAVVELTLEDVSRVDGLAEVLGNVTIDDPSNVPIAFEIPYDPAEIDERNSYSVRARILVGGRPRWVSETANPVLTRGNDASVDILVTAAREGTTEGAAEGDGDPMSTADFAETYWKLTRLGDHAVAVADAQREPHLVFRQATGRVEGSGGCNQFGGNYTVAGSNLGIEGTVSTMMACMEGMDTEQEFFSALEAVRSWRIEGQHLELYDAAGARLARFEATYLD